MVECRQIWYWRRSWEWKRSCILIPWATGSGLNAALREAWAIETSKPAPIVIHFLQQGSIYFNKVTPLNSVTPFEGHFLTIHHSQPLRSKELQPDTTQHLMTPFLERWDHPELVTFKSKWSEKDWILLTSVPGITFLGLGRIKAWGQKLTWVTRK